LREI
jgi:ribonuclease HI